MIASILTLPLDLSALRAQAAQPLQMHDFTLQIGKQSDILAPAIFPRIYTVCRKLFGGKKISIAISLLMRIKTTLDA